MLCVHLRGLERIVPPQQFELARFALVLKSRRQLEKRALTGGRHDLFTDLVITVIDLNCHHQISGVLERIRVFAQEFLGVQQVVARNAPARSHPAPIFRPSLMLPRPIYASPSLNCMTVS